MVRLAIIAAMELEIRPLLRDRQWRRSSRVSAGRCFECQDAVVVCAGIGQKAARRAAVETVQAFRPKLLVSAGLAGALSPELKTGQVVIPAKIVDASGRAFELSSALAPDFPAIGTLLSADQIAGPEEKCRLAIQYQADLVDMESAAVAEVAAEQGIDFMAVKAVSDEHDFALPEFARFVDDQGRFRTGRFLRYAAFRPRIWGAIRKLSANSAVASQSLCRVLRRLLEVRAEDATVNLKPLACK